MLLTIITILQESFTIHYFTSLLWLFALVCSSFLIASFNVSYSLFIYNIFNDVAELRFVDRCCLCNKTYICISSMYYQCFQMYHVRDTAFMHWFLFKNSIDLHVLISSIQCS